MTELERLEEELSDITRIGWANIVSMATGAKCAVRNDPTMLKALVKTYSEIEAQIKELKEADSGN